MTQKTTTYAPQKVETPVGERDPGQEKRSLAERLPQKITQAETREHAKPRWDVWNRNSPDKS